MSAERIYLDDEEEEVAAVTAYQEEEEPVQMEDELLPQDQEEAILLIWNRIQEDPSDISNYEQLVKAYYEAGKLQDVIEACQMAEGLMPLTCSIYETWLAAEETVNQSDKVLELFDRALDCINCKHFLFL